MTVPSPDDLASALAGDLIFVPFGDSDAAAAIAARLAELDGAATDRFAFEVTYAEALLRAGRPAAAAPRIEAAFRLRRSGDGAAMGRLHWLAVCTGQAGRARRTLKEHHLAAWDEPDPVVGPFASDFWQVAVSALWLGDVGALERAADLEARHGDGDLARLCLGTVRAGGLAEVVAAHQEIVIDCLAGTQYWLDLFPDIDDHTDAGLLVMTHYLAADRAQCRSIEDAMFAALDRVYVSAGKGAGAYLPHLLNHVVAVPEAAAGAAGGTDGDR